MAHYCAFILLAPRTNELRAKRDFWELLRSCRPTKRRSTRAVAGLESLPSSSRLSCPAKGVAYLGLESNPTRGAWTTSLTYSCMAWGPSTRSLPRFFRCPSRSQEASRSRCGAGEGSWRGRVNTRKNNGSLNRLDTLFCEVIYGQTQHLISIEYSLLLNREAGLTTCLDSSAALA